MEKGEGKTIQATGPPLVLEKRSAKSEEVVFCDGAKGCTVRAMGGGGGITKRPRHKCPRSKRFINRRSRNMRPSNKRPKNKRPKNEGEVVIEARSKELGSCAGITKRPRTDGEVVIVDRSKEVASGDVIAKHPNTEGVVAIESEMEQMLADSKRPRMNEEDVSRTKEADYDSEEEYVRQNLIYKKMLTRPHNAPGKDGKRRTVVRLDKESIEIRMSQPPPTPYPRMSDKHIDRIEQQRPGFRAEEDELTALGQKLIDRDSEMRRQYALYGYAELEFTDDDEDDDVDEMLKNWRSTAELKAAGCFDGY